MEVLDHHSRLSQTRRTVRKEENSFSIMLNIDDPQIPLER